MFKIKHSLPVIIISEFIVQFQCWYLTLILSLLHHAWFNCVQFLFHENGNLQVPSPLQINEPLEGITTSYIYKKGASLSSRWLFSLQGRMFLMGLMIGPLGHFWYTKLADKLVLGTGPKVVLKKIGVDQIIFTPIITCIFFGGKNYTTYS